MRCPHCRGQIPGGSRFCGVCGADVTTPPTRASRQQPSAQGEGASASLFELPVSKGARLARVFVVLALDLLLAGAGVAMILAYLDARQAAAGEVASPPDAGAAVEVAALPPRPIEPGSEPPAAEGGAGAGAGEAPGRREEPAAREPSRQRQPQRESRPEPADGPDEPDEPRRRSEPEPEPGSAPEPERESEPEPGDDPGQLADPYPEPGSTGEPRAGTDAGVDQASEVERLAARISLLVDRHQAQLQRCYERAAKLTTPSEPLGGRVEVRFRVTPEGRAEDVQVHANDTGSRGLGECLTGLVASWSFPAGAREPTEFLWPFVFRAPR